MQRATINSLVGIRFAESSVHRRALPRGCSFRADTPEYREYYDDKTLFYTAVQTPTKARLRLFGPRLLNFSKLVHAARFTGDGIPLTAPHLRHFKRFSIADFVLANPIGTVAAILDDVAYEMPVIQADHRSFEGLNVLYTQSRNNDITWICDWVRFHHRHHGANALVLADNGSTAYSPQELEMALHDLGVLKALRVISAPFRFGPNPAICRRSSRARFLQAAMANIARDIYLDTARAVLVCDVDEIVRPLKGETVFDACVASRFGFFTFAGNWRFEPTKIVSPRHADHVWIDPARGEACSTKYVVAPQGPLGKRPWLVHSLERVPRSWFLRDDEFRFAHCHAISTAWKPGRNGTQSPADALEYDAELATMWHQVSA